MSRQRVGARLRTWMRSSSTQSHLLMAAKSAIAAGAAWAVALLVPGVAAEYPYYAPLGAIIAMSPTVARSAKSGLQTILGLALGAVIAVGVVALGRPTPITVGLAVGLAVLLASARIFGEQRGWVASAALFVLLIGYSQAEEYSFGYIVQMLIGVVIGLLVNFLFPPLYFSEGQRALTAGRQAAERRLRQLADLLESDDAETDDDGESLRQAVAAARSMVESADESRRGNPRARRHPGAMENEQKQLRALERITRCIEEIGDIAEGAADEPRERYAHSELRMPLAAVGRVTADAIAAWNDGELTPERLDDAEAQLAQLVETVDAAEERGAPLRVAMTASTMLQRIQLVLSGFVD
ncbi:FUSC family protein [Diaminobutyricimonas sp. TR449]|uniref:FUSC family protein n=1 Tax=Diaminobutyricimonas sp. TR449 TaxID=2708076 RepID=UPI0014247F8C|nr:FUSC family protein [Diaminobutyricimonas sp. TR449]